MRSFKKLLYKALFTNAVVVGLLSISPISSAVIDINTGGPSTCGAPICSYTTPANNSGYSSGGYTSTNYVKNMFGIAKTDTDQPFFYDLPRTPSNDINISDSENALIKQRTLQSCSQASGHQCNFLGVISNQCAAVAYNNVERFGALGVGNFKDCNTAQRDAISKCQKDSKTSPNACKIIAVHRNKGSSLWDKLTN